MIAIQGSSSHRHHSAQSCLRVPITHSSHKRSTTPEYQTIMNIEDIKSAFSDGRRMSQLVVKMGFKPMVKAYVKLMHRQEKTEIVEKLKVLIKNKLWVESDIAFNPGNIKSKLKTINHGDAWINNFMFSSEDPKVI